MMTPRTFLCSDSLLIVDSTSGGAGKFVTGVEELDGEPRLMAVAIELGVLELGRGANETGGEIREPITSGILAGGWVGEPGTLPR